MLAQAEGGLSCFLLPRFTPDGERNAIRIQRLKEVRSRFIVERLALALQASLLLRAGNSQVADTFCESRLAGAHGQTFGTLPAHAPMHALIERAFGACET